MTANPYRQPLYSIPQPPENVDDRYDPFPFDIPCHEHVKNNNPFQSLMYLHLNPGIPPVKLEKEPYLIHYNPPDS
jgi:hypothetical protein